MDAPSDRMLLVGLRESEVAPDREARRARGRLDLELIEHCGERAGGGREVGDAQGDVVEHGCLAIDEAGQVLDERLRGLKMRSVVGVREEDQLGVWQRLLQDVGIDRGNDDVVAAVTTSVGCVIPLR
jgi:hypothetical protein